MQRRRTKPWVSEGNEGDIDITDKATRRVIAPYVKIVRRSDKLQYAKEPELRDQRISFFDQNKPDAFTRDLTACLAESADVITLLKETAEVLKITTGASCCTLYMVDPVKEEIYQVNKSKRWKIQMGTTVAAFVAYKREYILVEDLAADNRFPSGIGFRSDKVKSVLCAPLVSPDGDCYAVCELTRDYSQLSFSKEHLKISIVVTGWVGATIYQNQLRQLLEIQQELNSYLLDLTKTYFAGTMPVEKIITDIIKFAKTTLGAEKGTFFIIDKDTEDLVAEVFEEGIDVGEMTMHKKNVKVKLAKHPSIAGLVARTGSTVNIADASNDPRFVADVEENATFVTKSVLCMPIVSVDTMLGVAQVVNKINGDYFTPTDENLFKVFSVYCALALNYTMQHQKMIRAETMFKSNLKMLQLVLKPCSHDLETFMAKPVVSVPYSFGEFKWYVSPEDYQGMPQLVLFMVTDLVGREDLNQRHLMEFILSVKKCYRNNPYHNFEHAFNVMHCMFNILRRNMDMFSEIEIKALLIAALCHDVDHGGFTNNFLQFTSDTLAQLYDESILEHYHYRVAMTILGAMPIFNLTSEEYELIAKEMKEAIMATDLANYFKVRKKLLHLYNEQQLSFINPRHRTLVKAILMTSCDLSGNCKPFPIAKTICENVLKEFYHQGDLEKQMGIAPLPLMDREKSQMVPEDQVQFMTVIVLPCLELLVNILPNTLDLHTDASILQNTWQEIISLKRHDNWQHDEDDDDDEIKPVIEEEEDF